MGGPVVVLVWCRCLELEPSVQDGSRRSEQQPAGMQAPVSECSLAVGRGWLVGEGDVADWPWACLPACPRLCVQAVGDAAEGGSSCCWSSSALVLYEYLEPLAAADPLTDVLGLTVGQGRPVEQQAGARPGSGSDQEEEEDEDGHGALPARATTSTVRGATTSAAHHEEPVTSRPAVSSEQQQQPVPRQQQASQPPPAAVLQEGTSIGGGERNRVTVVSGVGRGWRDEASGALVVQFEDGARVRLDQDAQVLTYRAGQGEEEEEQSFVLPGSSRQGQRVKIPREVRDRMKHLGDFIRAMHGNR